MARIRKEKKKSNLIMMILVGIMLFGTVAAGFLFQNTGAKGDRPDIIPLPTSQEDSTEEMITIRHNPVDMTINTGFGQQVITHDEMNIYIDANHRLANSTLTFDIELVNMTKANYTGGEMTVEDGDIVQADYTGRLENGEVFDTSHEEIARNESIPKAASFAERPLYEPLEFTVGVGRMILGFDEAVVGMTLGGKKTVEIPPEKGYGPHDPSLVKTIPIIKQMPKKIQIIKRQESSKEFLLGQIGLENITTGQVFAYPGTNFNASIYYIAGDMVIIELLLNQGDTVQVYDYPWNSTVVSESPGAVFIEHNVNSGDTVKFPTMPWNSTIL